MQFVAPPPCFFSRRFLFSINKKELKKMIIDNIDPKTVRGSVGLMLREERLTRGLSFEQTADSARIPARYLHRLERGKGYYFVFFKRLLSLYGKQVNIELVDRR